MILFLVVSHSRELQKVMHIWLASVVGNVEKLEKSERDRKK